MSDIYRADRGHLEKEGLRKFHDGVVIPLECLDCGYGPADISKLWDNRSERWNQSRVSTV
jgi:hypothetical protein